MSRAKRPDTVRLGAIDASTLAHRVASEMRDHLTRQARALSPAVGLIVSPAVDALDRSIIYRLVDSLTLYAQGRRELGTVSASECVAQLTPLYQSCMRLPDKRFRAPTVEGLATLEPTTELACVIIAALGREQMDGGKPVTAKEVACLIGVDRAYLTILANAGEVPGAFRVPGVRGLDEWRFKGKKLARWVGEKQAQAPSGRVAGGAS